MDALEDLFPAPSSSRSKLLPRTWPGITPNSTNRTRDIIKDSRDRWHVFFIRGYRAHNHSVHYALALWALGADDEIIKAAYDFESASLLPRFSSPAKITAENFHQHLGDDEFYSAYLDYFTEIVKNQGVVDALEEHVFSVKANFIPGRKKGEQPEMLNRLMDGIIHSMIHVGYSLEFGLPGMMAEGLAWAAVHFASSATVIPASLWVEAEQSSQNSTLISRFLKLGTGTTLNTASQTSVHALTVIARILKDPRFDAIPDAKVWDAIFSDTDAKHGDAISEYVSAWTFDRKNPLEFERKIEELVYVNVLIYAVAGWSKDDSFRADFYHLHLVTSALFLYPIADVLKPTSQELLLRSYFAVCLTWWIGRGRPGLDIPAFFSSTSVNPGPVVPFPVPRKDALPSADSLKASSPNPWLQLVQEALVVPEDHFPKILRALAHFSELYGGRKSGLPDLTATELSGAELIDGTLFVRAAVLTNSKLRRETDVDMSKSKYWDRRGFYKVNGTSS